MKDKVKLKEAIKFSLAFALVYGIALKVNWLSPSWAGWSVVAISATSGGGESFQKGLLRIWGTILACIIGITIISLAAQSRWLFVFLTAGWLFFSSYKMLASKEKSYFWFVAAYVTLVITAAGPSSIGGFYLAVFRTMETILGIVVYTLVAVFIWPRTNIGTIKKAVCSLLDTQTKLIKGVYAVLIGITSLDKIRSLSQLEVKQLEQFSASLKAEGSESYQVKELKPLWDQYEYLNGSLIKSFDRLFGGIEDVSIIDKELDRPGISRFFEEIEHRFTVLSDLVSGKKTSFEFQDIRLKVTDLTRTELSYFDKAALSIVITELNAIDAISKEMVNVAMTIADANFNYQKSVIKNLKSQNKPTFRFPVLDVEYLKGAFYVAATVIFGFLIWFYVNPPGHASWYILGGVFALLFAGAQQVNTLKLIGPFIIVMFLVGLIYVFVLPKLSNFHQLGLLIFSLVFVINYFLSGPSVVVFNMVILQVLVINNPQSYDPVSLVNSFVFVPTLLIFLFYMSYLINTPRPEKAFISLVSRFFKSAKYLVSQQAERNTKNASSFIQQYKIAFYQHELESLPAKMNAWGKAIDKSLFPNTDYDQIEQMVSAMEVIVIRMETLIAANNVHQEEMLPILNDTIEGLRLRLSNVFDNWDNIEEEDIKNNISQLVLNSMDNLEKKLKNIVAENEYKIKETEGIQFYHLLGGFRGVTEATLSFAKAAGKLDWKQWKEERFQ